MKKTLILLRKLQDLMRSNDGDLRSVAGRIACLRAYVPDPYLARFDEIANKRRIPVAAVTHEGACGSCQTPLSLSAEAIREVELEYCPSCGCFLYVRHTSRHLRNAAEVAELHPSAMSAGKMPA